MKSRIFWGISLILVAIALILSVCGFDFGLPGGVETRQIVLGLLCLLWVVRCFVYKHFASLFFPLALLVIIFEAEIAAALNIASGELAPWWVLIVIALLLNCGFSLLFSHGKTVVFTDADGVSVRRGKKTGVSTTYIDCSEKFSEHIESNLGSCVIHFSNEEAFVDGSELILENNLGSIVIHIPEGIRIQHNLANTLGSIKVERGLESAGEKTLIIRGENNLGSIVIRTAE